MDLTGKTVVVTGGTRGLGAGIAIVLAEHGANVLRLARTHPADENMAETGDMIVGDIVDAQLAQRVIAEHSPDVIILCAGDIPPTLPIDVVDWEAFSAPWNTDVRGALAWIQASLTAPLRPGSQILAVSSGAALNGSPLSGGYAGAKRMLWLMSNYANALAHERGLGLNFQTVLPMQMVAGTGVGDAAATAYGAKMDVTPEAFLARFGAPLTPRSFGEHVATILGDANGTVRAYGIKGDTGITTLETELA